VSIKVHEGPLRSAKPPANKGLKSPTKRSFQSCQISFIWAIRGMLSGLTPQVYSCFPDLLKTTTTTSDLELRRYFRVHDTTDPRNSCFSDCLKTTTTTSDLELRQIGQMKKQTHKFKYSAWRKKRKEKSKQAGEQQAGTSKCSDRTFSDLDLFSVEGSIFGLGSIFS